jgi:hypothetical protein
LSAGGEWREPELRRRLGMLWAQLSELQARRREEEPRDRHRELEVCQSAMTVVLLVRAMFEEGEPGFEHDVRTRWD